MKAQPTPLSNEETRQRRARAARMAWLLTALAVGVYVLNYWIKP